ncbi:prephenate dehydrogenase, partial [Calderihabitans maritimus]
MKRVEKVAIVGLGLIGGSLGMAFTQGNVVEQVVGIDRDRNSLELGLATQSIHHGTQDLEQGVRGADLVILAVPLGQIVPVAREIKPFLAPGSIVTDVGSTKVDIVKNLEELFYPQIHYVGGHPMAGSERAGIEAADRYLFENAVYLLTPTERTDRQALEIVTALIEKTGARVKTVSPEEHDLIVAAVSHLPHVIAAALVNTVGGLADEYPDILTLAAGGFRDTTRIAGSNPELWRDICLANAEKIIKMIRHFRHWLDQFEAVMAAGDKDTLTGIFRQAQEIRS